MLIMFHELGHFITAKLSGVRVNEFAIGMGPAILKKQKGETVYALRIIPFGGYCAMEGEDEISDDPGSFHNKPIWKRIMIVAAGSVMNLLVGLAVLTVLFSPTKGWYIPTIANLPEQNAAVEESGLMAGDTVYRVDGYRVHMCSDILVGFQRAGDVDDHEITVLRSGEKVVLSNVPKAIGEILADNQIFAVERTSFLGKIKFIFDNAYNLIRMVKVGLVDLITGGASLNDMSGPIGIGEMMVNTAKVSMFSLWFLVAFISINLGIMNLLPLPALDGGRLFFLIIEIIRRKPVPAKYEAYVHGAGFVLLLILMAIVSFNDIIKLFKA